MQISRRKFFQIAGFGELGLMTLGVASCTPTAREGLSSSHFVHRFSEAFRNPPKAYRPMVRWWWPGGDVTSHELRREVKLMDEAGFGGAEIQPFNFGLKSDMSAAERARVNDYLTPSFFDHMRSALQEARGRRMWIDVTFGSGWPFGGGKAITPELAAVELRFTHLHVRGPAKFHQKIEMPQPATIPLPLMQLTHMNPALPNGWAERFEKRSKLVAVVAYRGREGQVTEAQSFGSVVPQVIKSGVLEANTGVVLTARLSPDGTLEWNVPPGDWIIFAFRQLPNPRRVDAAVGGPPQLILDHLKRAAFEAHAHRVGDSMEQQVGNYFGKGLRAIFCDSLEVFSYLWWTDNFAEEFRRRRGYNLIPYLPVLKQAGMQSPAGPDVPALYDIPEIGEQVRYDYRRTVSEMIIEAVYQPFADWARQRKLLSRVQAHGAPADLLKAYGLASIPETETLEHGGHFDFLKMAVSAGDLYGRKIVSSESFDRFGNPYGRTLEQIKAITDRMITAGVNEIIYHGFPYDYMDRPDPGWYPWNPPAPFTTDMNDHNTFWPYIGTVNAYITRLQYISRNGTSIVPVAVYRGELENSDYTGPVQPYIGTSVFQSGYAYDHINADALLKSRIENTQLITPGGARFSALVFQNEPAISLELAEKLLEFVHARFPVLFIGQAPKSETQFLNNAARTQKVRAIMEQCVGRGNTGAVAPSVADAVAQIQKIVRPNVVFGGQTSLPFIQKRAGPLDIFFLRNPDSESKSVEVTFRAGGTPELWDPWTGTISSLSGVSREGDSVRVHLDLTPYGSKLIVFNPNHQSIPSEGSERRAENSSASPLAIGASGWSIHATGLGPEGTPVIVDLQMTKLVDWRATDALKEFSGRGTYQTQFTISPGMVGKDQKLLLNLGEVRDVAEVNVNGKAGPTLLMHPYAADITDLVKEGDNLLEITVVNSLENAMLPRMLKMIANPLMKQMQQLMHGKFLSSQSSGLLGPVTLSVRD